MVAVQWHPERTYESSAASRALFAAFLEAARSWAPSRVTAGEIEKAFLQAGIAGLSPGAYEQFLAYFTVLLRWNAQLNLTAIREPEQIIQRHFVECAFAAQHLPWDVATLLDYGSGAGLPGIPIAICRPEIRVTLAESQGKKASFLREAARSCGHFHRGL